ncbi:hypothetical protein V144x_43430 [Gimesia aquarii]|uniref:Uncharacterized protein n=1 Tax=Gimesia aquarii TaxID=2527964 RepID=A0A517W0Q5_9PLAN|nr:hypothetical protein V144x_43430 [Gimesia aquarii]
MIIVKMFMRVNVSVCDNRGINSQYFDDLRCVMNSTHMELLWLKRHKNAANIVGFILFSLAPAEVFPIRKNFPRARDASELV